MEYLGTGMTWSQHSVCYLHILYDALKVHWGFCIFRSIWNCFNLANGTPNFRHASEIQHIHIEWACCRDSLAEVLCSIYLHLDQRHITHNLVETLQEHKHIKLVKITTPSSPAKPNTHHFWSTYIIIQCLCQLQPLLS